MLDWCFCCNDKIRTLNQYFLKWTDNISFRNKKKNLNFERFNLCNNSQTRKFILVLRTLRNKMQEIFFQKSIDPQRPQAYRMTLLWLCYFKHLHICCHRPFMILYSMKNITPFPFYFSCSGIINEISVIFYVQKLL